MDAARLETRRWHDVSRFPMTRTIEDRDWLDDAAVPRTLVGQFNGTLVVSTVRGLYCLAVGSVSSQPSSNRAVSSPTMSGLSVAMFLVSCGSFS